jgi:hypothetical protein
MRSGRDVGINEKEASSQSRIKNGSVWDVTMVSRRRGCDQTCQGPDLVVLLGVAAVGWKVFRCNW